MGCLIGEMKHNWIIVCEYMCAGVQVYVSVDRNHIIEYVCVSVSEVTSVGWSVIKCMPSRVDVE